MNNRPLADLKIEDVHISKETGFNGYNVFFSVSSQTFHFLVGKGTALFPLNAKHAFNEKSQCFLCEKNIYPVPVGQQLCAYFQKHNNELLAFFKENHANKFL